ncbi:Protein of unknown function [Gryllus bimaculatus]|nr:Protein of unknown function [Gryllus bimaculatus]
MKLLFVVAIAWVGVCAARRPPSGVRYNPNRQDHHFEDSPSPENEQWNSEPFQNRGDKRFGNKINKGMFPPGDNSYVDRWIVAPSYIKGPPYPFPLPLNTRPRPRYSDPPQEDQEWQDTPSVPPIQPPQPVLPTAPPAFPSRPPAPARPVRPPKPNCVSLPRPPPLQDEEEDAWDAQGPADDDPGAPDSEQADEMEPRRPPFLYQQLYVPAGALDENRGEPPSAWGFHQIAQPPRGRLV